MKTASQMPLPPLLVELLASGRWRQPTDTVIYAAVPFLREPVNFLLTEAAMRFESQVQGAGFPHFREYRGTQSPPRPLPWLDADRSLFIAVNREIGADLGIALDYRASITDPRVVGSDWWTGDHTCHWREVSVSFAAFVNTLRL